MQDQLNDVENRAAFTSRLDKDLTRWHGTDERLALLVAEVSTYTRGNEALSTARADRVRITMADRLTAALGPDDILMRISTNEFAIICHGICGWAAMSTALERVRAVAHTPVHVSGEDIRGTISVSAIFADEVGHGQDSAGTLLRHAGLLNCTTGLRQPAP
jgi:diguanylate cyclase (GGDEF)-like protein